MMPNRRVIQGLLVAVLAILVFATIALVDISRWPPRPRFFIFVPATPPPPQSPSQQPLVRTAPPVQQAPQPVPLADRCTNNRLAAQPPGGQQPRSAGIDYGGEPIGSGRRYLEGVDPTYSPDGMEIAIARDSPDGDTHIWAAGVDGTRLRQLTFDRDPDPAQSTGEFDPAWSPDGSRIAFVSHDGIWTIAPDGSSLTRLTKSPSAGGHMSPAWSPDGRQLVYVAQRPDNRLRDLWIIDADGTNGHKVGSLTGYEHFPAFSPDGRQLVFMSVLQGNTTRPAGALQLMIINVDGTGLCQLTTGGANDSRPTWSGSGIVFQRDCCRLWLIRPDNSGPDPLPAEDGRSPIWSPDGTRIAFEHEGHVYVLNVRGGVVKPLTRVNVLPIVIYINPGHANVIRPKSEAPVRVAILSAPWFSPVQRMDRETIKFGPAGKGRTPTACEADEVNDDGTADLVCSFDVAALFSGGDTEGVLSGAGVDGIRFEGRDAVQVVY